MLKSRNKRMRATGALGLGLWLGACAADTPAPPDSEQPVTAGSAALPGQTTADVQDLLAPSGNEALDGPTLTNVGEFMVDVRTKHELSHSLLVERSNASDVAQLGHFTQTSNGRVFRFSIPYLGGSQTLSVTNTVFVYVQIGQQELRAIAGTVSIEPLEDGQLRVSFEGLEMKPVLGLASEEDQREALDWLQLGSASVVGPFKYFCQNEATREANRNQVSVIRITSSPEPVEPDEPFFRFEETWIEDFCSKQEEG